jgi:hypothetical protein
LEGNFLILKEFLPDCIHEQNTQEYANLLIFQEFLTKFCKSKSHKHMQEGHGDMRKEIEIVGKMTLYQSYEVSEIVSFLNF